MTGDHFTKHLNGPGRSWSNDISVIDTTQRGNERESYHPVAMKVGISGAVLSYDRAEDGGVLGYLAKQT
jgi:hypothetical protein